jgi:hypothetical protein
MKRKAAAAFALAMIVGLGGSAQGQEPREPEGAEPRQEVAGFIGGTYTDGNTTFTLGADYEFRAWERFGVGGLLDYAAGELDEVLLGPAAFIHPLRGLTITLAPALDRRGGENEAAFRLGFNYKFERGRLTFGPEYNVDFIGEETAQVFGVTVGFLF